MTIAEYCDQMKAKTIIVNREYQRSPKRWPTAARSFLIDTILEGYPIPKIILAQKTDLRTKQTLKEIVDGQQRSMAIFEYYQDEFRITGDSAFTGLRFSDLEAPQQTAFITYALGVDLFVGADQSAIRQMFRRMNSYTVPLNHQETRYATHQGPFKWFIFDQSGRYSELFKRLGVLTEKQISAMQDGSLLTELCVAFTLGIKTASKKILDDFYKNRDEQFPEREALETQLQSGFDLLTSLEDIHRGPLMEPRQFYTLVLAASHMQRAVPLLNPVYEFPADFSFSKDAALSSLGSIALALQNDESSPGLAEFMSASSSATNTERNRSTRFLYYCRALTGELHE